MATLSRRRRFSGTSSILKYTSDMPITYSFVTFAPYTVCIHTTFINTVVHNCNHPIVWPASFLSANNCGKFSPQSFLSWWQYQCMCYVSTLHMLSIGPYHCVTRALIFLEANATEYRFLAPLMFWAGEGLDS